MSGQSDFTAALLRPEMAVPQGLTNPDGSPASKRFDVYRNNVVVSLTEALRTAFPVIEKLLGEAFFNAMAGIFVRSHPPTSPLMMFYGEAMPEFLAGFPPLAHLPYLSDIARLELAMRHAYHASDAAPVSPARIAALAESDLLSATLRFAPALRVIRSAHPVYSIWAHNMGDGPAPQAQAEDVLITRPEFDPAPHLLPKGGADFIAALSARTSIGAAVELAGPAFDPGPTLGLLLAGGAITSITTGKDP